MPANQPDITLPSQFRFMPVGKMFDWVREFPDGEKRLIGQYYPGMTYNCTKEPIHDALREKCKEWLGKGMIRIIELPAGVSLKMVNVQEGE